MKISTKIGQKKNIPVQNIRLKDMVGLGNDLQSWTYIAYGGWSQGTGFLSKPLFLLFSLTGFIVAAIKCSQAKGTIYESHLLWITRTFAFSFIGICLIITPLILLLVNLSTTPIGQVSIMIYSLLCLILLIILGVWYQRRMKKGFLLLKDNKSIENPKALF